MWYNSNFYAPVSYYDKYSWATSFTYVMPNYQKIRKQIKEKQEYYNTQWVPLKASYAEEISMEKKSYWLIDAKVPSAQDLVDIVDFVNKTESIWIDELIDIDSLIMEMYFGKRTWINTPSCITKATLFSSQSNYIKYRWELLKEIKDILEEKRQEKLLHQNWRGGIGSEMKRKADMVRVNRLSKELLNRLIPPQSLVEKEPDLRKWKRINRNYVYWLSYKPLKRENIISPIKKKVLNIVDWSWSMIGNSLEMAWDFMYAIEDTWLFDCTSFFSQQDTALLSKDYTIYYNNWWEWFKDIEDRIVDMWFRINDFDYIFIYTDCDIGRDQLNALKKIVQSKKHMLFCFNRRYGDDVRNNHPSLKVVNISNTQDMTNHLISYV